MSGRFSEIGLFNAAGEKQNLKLVFTLGALAAIETALGRPLMQTFQGINVDGIKTVLFHGTREAHPELELADFDKFSRLPLVKIAEAFNRDIGADEIEKAEKEKASNPDTPAAEGGTPAGE